MFLFGDGYHGGAGAVAVRKPVHAGAFYPADREELSGMLDKMLSISGQGRRCRGPRAIIVPHAGYAYSGGTAAVAYKELAGSGVRRVILLAPSHYVHLHGAVLINASYKTPLGLYPLDTAAAGKLKGAGIRIEAASSPFSREHSDEVQIPFLQKVLPDALLVPLVVGDADEGALAGLARAISGIMDQNTVVVVSSDFTHYGPRFGYAPAMGGAVRDGIRALDDGAIHNIIRGDQAGFDRFIDDTGATVCGAGPIRLLLAIFEKTGFRNEGRLLKYSTSGEQTGDWQNSVSYAAILFESEGAGDDQAETVYVDAAGKKTLLALARHVLERFVKDKVSRFGDKELAAFDVGDQLRQKLGVFVTLKKHGELRGCIGHVLGERPVFQGVIENTINAAAHDPRFDRVTPAELDDIDMEISIMSPLAKISADQVKVGRDGLVLRLGGNSGLLLPQVPVEWKWDRKTYLEHLSMKAGLPRDAYKNPRAELLGFTAQVLGERE
ncbi:MAG: hypothetical protein A2583_04085 [Bdellovibrionales bacterium RIFOXYD1_FULL_53_11]|nr:MAG: hypothetical protein A2583_04085 [Bdellovibrionales bacterium RIFOXYD1_FULL_53_11]